MGTKKNTPASGLMTALIGARFTVVGLFFGGAFLWRQVAEIRAVDTYQRVDATIDHVALSSGSKGSLTLSVKYHYQWAGRRLEGDRVAPLAMKSNSDKEDWHARLSAKMARQETVAAWLDPSQPQKVMLDKTVSWAGVLLLSIFGVGFPLMGAFLIREGLRIWRSPQTPEPISLPPAPDSPQFNPAGQAPSSTNVTTNHVVARRFLAALMAAVSLFCVLWIYNTWPSNYKEILASEGSYLRFIGLIFPLFGLFMLVPVWRIWQVYRRLPDAPSSPPPLQPAAKAPPEPATAALGAAALTPGQVTAAPNRTRLIFLLGLLVAACATYVQKESVLAWAASKGWLPGPQMHAVALPDLPPLKPADQALIDAAQRGDAAGVNHALDSGAHVNVYDNTGESALLQAAALGHDDVVRTLLQRGADLQFTNSIHPHQRGDTALLRAAYRGHADLFEFLLKAGAHADVKNQWGWSAVHMAAAGDCTRCLDALIPRQLPLDEAAHPSRGETPFLMAAGKDATQAMAWLKDHGANTLAKDDHGYDALGWARFYKAPTSETWLRAHVPELSGQGQ
jgi:hypothetical protein